MKRIKRIGEISSIPSELGSIFTTCCIDALQCSYATRHEIEAVSLIGETKLKILKQLDQGPNHGYQLHKEVGVSTPVVYQHLSDLEEAGMLEPTRVDNDNRDKVEYHLTEDGEKLLALLTDY